LERVQSALRTSGSGNQPSLEGVKNIAASVTWNN
jgi:hypothetical protein